MRLSALIALFVYVAFSLTIVAEQIPRHGRQQVRTFVTLVARHDSSKAAFTAVDAVDNGAAATATSAATTSVSHSNATASTTTSIASLNTSAASDNSTETAEVNTGGLPIDPKITPALGVGGFLLMVLGLVYALIGIQNLWVQVFLSAAFLTSLGVTVLIVYVMSPPVREAIQGAYLVAVFFTGVTFGGLSIVFKELTEGLGCLLGGFCLSMWLLSLKPGGLLTGNETKAGFIGALSVAFYALSFSHYTRPYGLIISTAFAGATALALGIDCFSRAGLKEFWLYIWGLNGDIFPLNTKTYPITRNIRVELAVTVIVCVLGVISQLRLWRVIRARRRNEERLRKEDQRKKEEAEAEAGRRLEENTMKERQEWEAMYGGASAEKSGSTTVANSQENSRKDSGDVEKGDAIEMESVSRSSDTSSQDSDSHREDDDDESSSGGSDSSDGTHEESTPGKMPRAGTPIPFKVFDALAHVKGDDESDVTAIVGSDVGSLRSRRLSGRSLLRQVSMMSGSRPLSQSEEALIPTERVHGSDSSVTGVVGEDNKEASCCSVTQSNHDHAEKASMHETMGDKGPSRQPHVAEAKENVASGKTSGKKEVAEKKSPTNQHHVAQRTVEKPIPDTEEAVEQSAPIHDQKHVDQKKEAEDQISNDTQEHSQENQAADDKDVSEKVSSEKEKSPEKKKKKSCGKKKSSKKSSKKRKKKQKKPAEEQVPIEETPSLDEKVTTEEQMPVEDKSPADENISVEEQEAVGQKKTPDENKTIEERTDTIEMESPQQEPVDKSLKSAKKQKKREVKKVKKDKKLHDAEKSKGNLDANNSLSTHSQPNAAEVVEKADETPAQVDREMPVTTKQQAEPRATAGNETDYQNVAPPEAYREAAAPSDHIEPQLKEGKVCSSEHPEAAAPDLGVHDATSSPMVGESMATPSASQESKPQPELVPCEEQPTARVDEEKQAAYQTKPEPKKKEKVKLNAETVGQIPQQTSRLILSYRTNEWAKHLSEAEAPGVEHIQPVEEESPSSPEQSQEVAAPVNVKELLQTPLDARPPPAVERRVSLKRESLKAIKDRRLSSTSKVSLHDLSRSHSRAKSRNALVRSPTQLSHDSSRSSLNLVRSPSPSAQPQGLLGGIRSVSTPFLSNIITARQPHEPEDSEKPQWKGPPPLLAVRESMVRSRLSSTSLSYDPWYSRNGSRLSVHDVSPRVSPTFSAMDEEDDIPLSQRRAMIQQQKMHGSQVNLLSPRQSRSRPGASRSGDAEAVMAAWRESVRDDIASKDPLASLNFSPVGVTEKRQSPLLGQSQRNFSTPNIDAAVVEGMQRGDMTDLHREALRRMQAYANKHVNRG